eukprot:9571392-Alexandrium_andersonii.AAC.1
MGMERKCQRSKEMHTERRRPDHDVHAPATSTKHPITRLATAHSEIRTMARRPHCPADRAYLPAHLNRRHAAIAPNPD